MKYVVVFNRVKSIIQIDNTGGFTKMIWKYQRSDHHLIHILSQPKNEPVENSGKLAKKEGSDRYLTKDRIDKPLLSP